MSRFQTHLSVPDASIVTGAHARVSLETHARERRPSSSIVMPTAPRRDAAVARMANERFKLHGLSLLGDAMRAVLAHVSRADVGERDAVDAVLKHLSRAELASGVVTRETIENALEEMRAEGEIDRAAGRRGGRRGYGSTDGCRGDERRVDDATHGGFDRVRCVQDETIRV